jgi:predicted ATPase
MKKIRAAVTKWEIYDQEIEITIEDSSLQIKAASRDKFNVQTTLFLKAEEALDIAGNLEDIALKLIKQQKEEKDKDE